MPAKRDLFGAPTKSTRGWTGLDRIRRRYGRLIGRIADGEASVKEMDDATHMRDLIVAREQEARVKWKKSFGS